MAETKDIGPFYWHWAWYADAKAPLFALEPTTEIDYPYRQGVSTAWKIPRRRKALVVGCWKLTKYNSEKDAILAALSGRVLSDQERKALEYEDLESPK